MMRRAAGSIFAGLRVSRVGSEQGCLSLKVEEAASGSVEWKPVREPGRKGANKLYFRQSGGCGDVYFQGCAYAGFNICGRATPWMAIARVGCFQACFSQGSIFEAVPAPGCATARV